MLKFEQLRKGAQVVDIAPKGPITIVLVDAVGSDAACVYHPAVWRDSRSKAGPDGCESRTSVAVK